MKKYLCKIIGHDAVRPYQNMPTYCQRCLVDLKREGNKWVEDTDPRELKLIR